MKKLPTFLILMAFSINSFAECITIQERNLLWLHARVLGSVKLFVSHSDLPFGTSVDEIQAMTAIRAAEINGTDTVLYVTQSWVPSAAPGFEAFATAEGVSRLYADGYCFGRIN
ncbi:MAG: hypothetical protein AB7T20_12040 [Steroidobacteraceae bacterium]